MTTPAASAPDRLALIVSGDEWLTRALESVLQPRGYRVLAAWTGSEALERARSARPDCILIATRLPDLSGLEVCRALAHDPSIAPGVLIAGLTPEAPAPDERLTWLRAGAWEFFGFPLDAEELLLKLERFVRAKREADPAWEVVLADYATGLYNRRGLTRRARELVAEALRLHSAIGCVVFGLDAPPEAQGAAPDAPGLAALRARVGSMLRTHARLSDTVGWWNGSEFAILAPATDAAGAAKLAQRVSRAIETAQPEPDAIPLLGVRAGYEGVSDAHATPVEPDDLLARARAALRLARAGGGARIRRFESGA